MSNLTFVTILAFLLGFLAGFLLQPWRLRDWRWSINRNLPRRCPVCGTWHLTKNLLHTNHRVVGFVRICKSCWRDQYEPFSKNKEKTS